MNRKILAAKRLLAILRHILQYTQSGADKMLQTEGMYVCIRGGTQKSALALRLLKICCASPFD
jgi:hypothetical protein